jgi:hypothetical protein
MRPNCVAGNEPLTIGRAASSRREVRRRKIMTHSILGDECSQALCLFQMLGGENEN